MSGLLLAAEILGLALIALLVLFVVGTGITLALLRSDRWAILLAPAVGVGALTIAFQFLTFVLPPHIVVIVVFAAGAVLTGVVLVRRVPKPPIAELAASLAISLATFMAMMQIVIQRGFYTLGGFPSDNIFIYVQAGQYLKNHTSPLLAGGDPTVSPGVFVLAVTGLAIPNSKGVFDAATSVLSGLPVYAVFDVVNALAVALAIGPLWFFMRSVHKSSWITAACACLLMATNQLFFWVVGNGFQQESLATPIFTAGLAIAVLAFRTRSFRAGALAGMLGGSLLGLYFPIALIFSALAAAALVVLVIVEGDDRLGLWRPLAGALCAGAAAGVPALYALANSGLAIWSGRLGSNIPAGGVTSFPAFPFLFGQLPYSRRWDPSALAYTDVERVLLPALVVLSVAALALLVLGSWRALTEHHAPEAALLIAGMAIALYEVAAANFPYGYVKAIVYIVPFISAFIALGATGWARWRIAQRLKVPWLGGVLAAVLIATAAMTSSDMIRAFLSIGPTLPSSYLSLAKVASDIPTGSRVFVDYQAENYADLVKLATVAYFLPDRSVRVYSGDLRVGTFPDQTTRPAPCSYEYVVSNHGPGTAFVLVDGALGQSLSVYRRQGLCFSP